MEKRFSFSIIFLTIFSLLAISATAQNNDGSCINANGGTYCGTQSGIGSCWCDPFPSTGKSGCHTFGDCCLDADKVCGPVCGNGVLEGREACDGKDFGKTSTDCAIYDPKSYVSGFLKCTRDCQLDTSQCIKRAACESTNSLALGNTKLFSYSFPQGVIDYEVTFSTLVENQAQFIVNGQVTKKLSPSQSDTLANGATITLKSIEGKTAEFCINGVAGKENPKCGDGIVNQESEQCDDRDFGKKSCQTYGFYDGVLSCTTDCSISTQNCRNIVCGDQICDKGESETCLQDCPRVCYELSSYPKMFVYGDTFNGEFIVGDHAPAGDVIALSDIQNSFVNKGIKVNPGKLASEIKDIKSVNAVVVGTACSNAAADVLLGNPADCTSGLEPGYGYITLFQNNGFTQVLVSGYSEQDIRRAASVLASYDFYKLSGTKVKISASSGNNVIEVVENNCAQTQTCKDSDGGENNIYIKGYLSVVNNPKFGTTTLYDYCGTAESGKAGVSEWSCSPTGNPFDKFYFCPNGCVDGACVPETSIKEQVKCVFEGNLIDGQKYSCYSDKGECSATGPNNACVIEVSGKKGEVVTWKSSCGGYAYTTIDGSDEYAYFNCAQTQTCTDSDGGKIYNVFGDVSQCINYGDIGQCKVSLDYCAGSELVEGFCIGDTAYSEFYPCKYGCYNGVCLDAPVCGNNICELGESKKCPSCNSNPCLPCKAGTCPQDCKKLKCKKDADCPTIACIKEPCPIYSCVSGQCVAKSTDVAPACIDSDGGRSYNTKGTVNILKGPNAGINYDDICTSPNNLLEQYCDNEFATSPSAENYNCLSGCRDGACVKSGITIEKVLTDKRFYGLSEKVNIIATVTSTDGNFGKIIAEITDPNYKQFFVPLTKTSCKDSSPNTGKTCIFTGTFTDTSFEGYYYLYLKSDDLLGYSGYASFNVIDIIRAAEYVILADIGLHRILDVNHGTEYIGNTPIEIYLAYYSDGQLNTYAAAYAFASREELVKVINDAFSRITNYRKEYIGENLVYIINDGYNEIILWTKNNVVIILESWQGAVAAQSPKQAAAAKGDLLKISGNVAQTGAQVPDTPTLVSVPQEIILAYLEKHPSDLHKIPPPNQVTKQDVIDYINGNTIKISQQDAANWVSSNCYDTPGG